MDVCEPRGCGRRVGADASWYLVKEGHWESGGYQHAVQRAHMLVLQSSSSARRIEQLACLIRCSTVSLYDAAAAVHSYMRLSGGSEKLEQAMRILFADSWVCREAVQGQHGASWPLVLRARRLWQHMGLSSKEYSRWMLSITKAIRYYWAVGAEGHRRCVTDPFACDFSI